MKCSAVICANKDDLSNDWCPDHGWCCYLCGRQAKARPEKRPVCSCCVERARGTKCTDCTSPYVWMRTRDGSWVCKPCWMSRAAAMDAEHPTEMSLEQMTQASEITIGPGGMLDVVVDQKDRPMTEVEKQAAEWTRQKEEEAAVKSRRGRKKKDVAIAIAAEKAHNNPKLTASGVDVPEDETKGEDE